MFCFLPYLLHRWEKLRAVSDGVYRICRSETFTEIMKILFNVMDKIQMILKRWYHLALLEFLLFPLLISLGKFHRKRVLSAWKQ